ncbi:MAG: serine--tRNA ligase [Candidatus Riflebacteria bacterium]|nr:serine--tRNA ligase [Candidatus Riflebacteria bacterium]
MIDIRQFREDPEGFKKSLGRKRFDPAVLNQVLELDVAKRQVQTQVERLRAAKNQSSKEISRCPPAQRASKIEEVKKLGDELAGLEKELLVQEEKLKELLIQIPNPPHESVPDGGKDEPGQTIREVGARPAFDFEPRDHLALGELHGTIDVQRASKLSGSRFSYLLGDLVHLQFALVQFALQKLSSKGFTPVVTPILVRELAMYGTGFFPADKNEIYKLQDEDLYLVGTSEVSLAGMYLDDMVSADSLPLRFVGYSTCLRREAGSYGKDTKGIFRVHQFDKVEMFSFTHPSRSWEEHELLLTVEEEIARELGFHYRVVNIVAGDLGAPAAKKYDLEVWLPGQNAYRELTSCSNCTDFQARRLNCRYKDDKGPHLVHTLNGTAIAIGRTLIALLETHQRADGTVVVPECLHRYLPEKIRVLGPRS